MSGEIIEVTEIRKELSISSDDVKRVVAHLAVIKDFVSSALVEGVDNDYGLVPGVKKKMLFKPGAEKLMRLFGLGVRYRPTENMLQVEENFALYSYVAEVYHLKSGTVISECEGVANSHEKKYKEKAQYSNGQKVGLVPIPVCDILNTLKKMAQKRAMVGAVITATGASDYFSQDPDEVNNQKPEIKKPTEIDASKFTTKEGTDFGQFLVTIGKHKNKTFDEIGKKDLKSYCTWISNNNTEINGKMKELLDSAREYLRG